MAKHRKESSKPAESHAKVALITGAGSGIGKATAMLLAEKGYRIGVLDIDSDEVHCVVKDIKAAGGGAAPLVADVSNAEQMHSSIDALVKQFGRLDVVFANAGINGVWTPLEDMHPDEWDRTIAINLRGTFLTVKYSIPHLKKKGGAIVVTSSVNGTRLFSNVGASAYASSKAAQVGFTKMIALELAKHKIRANVICPGPIATLIIATTEKRNFAK